MAEKERQAHIAGEKSLRDIPGLAKIANRISTMRKQEANRLERERELIEERRESVNRLLKEIGSDNLRTVLSQRGRIVILDNPKGELFGEEGEYMYVVVPEEGEKRPVDLIFERIWDISTTRITTDRYNWNDYGFTPNRWSRTLLAHDIPKLITEGVTKAIGEIGDELLTE